MNAHVDRHRRRLGSTARPTVCELAWLLVAQLMSHDRTTASVFAAVAVSGLAATAAIKDATVVDAAAVFQASLASSAMLRPVPDSDSSFQPPRFEPCITASIAANSRPLLSSSSPKHLRRLGVLLRQASHDAPRARPAKRPRGHTSGTPSCESPAATVR